MYIVVDAVGPAIELAALFVPPTVPVRTVVTWITVCGRFGTDW